MPTLIPTPQHKIFEEDMENKPMLVWHRPFISRLLVSLDTQTNIGTSIDAFGGPQQSVVTVTTTADFASG